jgi:hypothetical protein
MLLRQIMRAMLLLPLATIHNTVAAQQSSIMQALGKGWANVDMRLRHEAVEQSNNLDDASALTLRTRLTYRSGKYKDSYAVVEFEDSRSIANIDDYSVPATGFNPGAYSVIADPKTTELDQAYIRYAKDNIKVKVGRQVIKHDAQRFVGDVGWRQDRQTFDAVTITHSSSKDVQLNYSYVLKRNRIYAEEADVDSKDHLFNGTMQIEMGKLVGYAYLLEPDDNSNNSLDTYGVSLRGTTPVDSLGLNGKNGRSKLKYGIEFATQDATTNDDYSAVYMMAEVSATINKITYKATYEVLGSDDGAYGFATPLATLHKFNGWTDTFLTTPDEGLVDLSVTASGRFQKGRWVAAYHIFDADESTDTIDDFGSEINLQYIHPVEKNVSVGIKYADYSAGDSATGKVDTQKLWIWGEIKF